MKSDDERRATHEEFRRIDTAFRAGDMDALRAALGNADDFPNTLLPLASFGPGGACLEYAIYHSPLPFIRTLLEIGADPNPADHAGFPPLIAVLSCSRPQPGAPGRPDVAEIIQLLLSFGADANQRGLNDYTPLHRAAGERNLPSRSCSMPVQTLGCERASTTTKRLVRWQRKQAFGKSRSCWQQGRSDS